MGGTGGNGGKIFSRDSSEDFEKLSSSQFNSILGDSELRMNNRKFNSYLRKQTLQISNFHKNETIK